MDYEKAYKEAIAEMRKMRKSWENLSYTGKTFLQDLEEIFPELRESEDEKTRRFIIHELACLRAGEFVGEEASDRYKELSNAISWLEKQKDCKWSEEDEKIIKRVDSLLYSQCKIHGSEYEEIHNWLKSIKPQPHWKPTEEQMEALKIDIDGYPLSDKEFKALKKLYEDIKKLFEAQYGIYNS